MGPRLALLIIIVLATTIANTSRAENMSVGAGAQGSFYIIEGTPEFSPGVGGFVYFDYRFAPHFSTQFTFGISMQDGAGPNAGDNSLLLLPLPKFDLKYYVLESSSRIDPYMMVGLGLFLLTEGSRSDGSTAFGFGANAGLGVDVYFSPAVSANLAINFTSIGMVGHLGGNNGSGLFPLTTSGGIGFHF